MRPTIMNSCFSGLIGLTAMSLLAGCPDRTISEVDPQQGRVEYKDIPVTVNRDIDILFLIDDSNSMADKQNNLANNFPNFINVLKTIPGGLPNVHLGVASSNMGVNVQGGQPAPYNIPNCGGKGDNGVLQTGMAGAEVNGKYLSDILPVGSTTRQTNYTGELAQVFGHMAQLGVTGCGFEQHLESAKMALSPQTTENAGFLRPSAYLAIIFIADEDDCSARDPGLFGPETAAMGPLQSFRCNRFGHTCDQGGADPNAMNQVGVKGMCHPNDNSQYLTKVSEYATFFKGLKEDPDMVIVAGIMGTTTPYQVAMREVNMVQQIAVGDSCMYQGANGTEVAAPSVRLQFLLDQFPGRSTFTTICQSNLSDGLTLIAELLKTIIGDPCITGNLADVDPTQDGEQVDCSVSFVQDQGEPNQREQIVPKCDATKSVVPCWYLEDDAMCMEGNHVKLRVEGQDQAPANTHIIANCVTGDDATP